MTMLNTLNGALRGTPSSGPEALLQMGNPAGSGTRDSAFAGLLKNFDSLGANDAAPKPTESTPSPADPAPTKAELTKPAHTQRLQSEDAVQTPSTADTQDAASDESTDAQATTQPTSAEQTAKPADAKKDAKDTKAEAKSDAADEKTTTTDAPQSKRSRKLLADAGSAASTAQTTAQDKVADPAAATGAVSAKPAKAGADTSELPAGTDPSAKSAAGQSAVAQAQGRAVDRAQDQQVADRGQQLQAQLTDLGSSPNLQAAAAQSFASELKSVMPAQGGARTGGIEGLAAAAQAGATASTTSAANDDSAAAPVIVNIAPQLDDAGFASELGARLTVLAQDGVQHAELHLNPADMGPVAVNIKLDGQQAQVTFHAAQADTRSVLEQGLPDLAAALAGAGLTLAGGGVFQQSQGGRERDGTSGQASGQNGGTQGIDATAATAAAQPVRVAQPRGVVDVYA